ncbi:MAG: NAD(P)/FAD-dependent oxidoreductase [Candidatus Micrarchaeia archaeon]
MHDVVVVGAGPSGSFAAAEAAKNGANVLVYEEHNHVGVPVQCAGLVSKSGLDSLGIDYRKSVLNEMIGANIFSPSGNLIVAKAREVKACVIDREVFDTLVFDMAERTGAKFIFGKRVKKSDVMNGKRVICADGAYSLLAREVGFPEIREYVCCAQAEFEYANIERNFVEVYLSRRDFPGFFGWVIPVNENEARVGLGVRLGLKVHEYFERFIRMLEQKEKIKRGKMKKLGGGCIPMCMREITATDKVALVGDAAGQVKATTGGGVFFGSSCGMIAGRVAASGESMLVYEKEWRRAYMRDISLHYRLRDFINSLDDASVERYFTMAKALGIEQFLTNFGEMDRVSAMVESLKGNPLYSLMPPFLR